jgi:hypothetical protein
MLLSITTTHRPATDLGYLLHKNPARSQELELAFGRAHMFHPEATDERCTFALALDIDPVGLVRGGDGKDRGLLDQYVNDRPYAASSFLSVAIAQALRTALGGRCEQRPELVQQAIPLEVKVTPLPVRGGPDLVERLFAPLGYTIAAEPLPLDETMPEWGLSAYVTLRLSAVGRSICASSTGRSTMRRNTLLGCAIAVSARSDPSQSASSSSGMRRCSASSSASRCVASTKRFSRSWPWRASRLIRGCSDFTLIQRASIGSWCRFRKSAPLVQLQEPRRIAAHHLFALRRRHADLIHHLERRQLERDQRR